MTAKETDAHDSTDIDRRHARALTEYMTVLGEGGDVYSVTTESGSEYAVDATPRVAATDGGEILDAGDDGEILEADTDTDDRPADCGCGAWNADGPLPCWACYRDGFDEPATDVK